MSIIVTTDAYVTLPAESRDYAEARLDELASRYKSPAYAIQLSDDRHVLFEEVMFPGFFGMPRDGRKHYHAMLLHERRGDLVCRVIENDASITSGDVK